MALKQRLRLGGGALALLCTVLLGLEGWRWYRARAFNTALDAPTLEQAARHDSPHGRFARALQLQRRGDFQQAFKLYNGLENTANASLRAAARYNMANAYLQQALAIGPDEQRDLAVPLIELAKTAYRELLRANSRHWDAKYNLERALQLLPDPQERGLQEWQVPEHSERSLTVKDTELQGLP